MLVAHDLHPGHLVAGVHPGVADPAAFALAHLLYEVLAVEVHRVQDVFPLHGGVDHQVAGVVQAEDVAGLPHLLPLDLLLELGEGAPLEIDVLVGLLQVPPRGDDPVPLLEVTVGHHLLAQLLVAQRRVLPGVDDVEHLARLGAYSLLAHLPDEVAPGLVLLVEDVDPFLGDMDLELAVAGHGVDVTGLPDVHLGQGVVRLASGGGHIDAAASVLALLRLNHVVGELGHRGQVLLEDLLLVLLVDLELLVVRVQEVDREAGHVLQVVLTGLGDAEVGLFGGDVADHTPHDEDGDDHQREHQDHHLPAQLQVAYESEQVSLHAVAPKAP